MSGFDMPAFQRRLVVEYIVSKVQKGIAVAFPKNRLLEMTVEEVSDIVHGELLYVLQAFLAGNTKEVVERKKVMVPLTWIEHIKQRFAPQWLIKIRPIKYQDIVTKTVITTTNICPHIDLPPRHKDHYRFVNFEEEVNG